MSALMRDMAVGAWLSYH